MKYNRFQTGNRKIRMAVKKPGFSCYTIRETIHGFHWIIHNHEEDINEPSCPHCHAKENNMIKLDIYSGCFYDYTNGTGRKQMLGRLSSNELKKLWSQNNFRKIVHQEREYYETTYCTKDPKRYPSLPPLPPFDREKSPFVSSKIHKFILRLQGRRFRI